MMTENRFPSWNRQALFEPGAGKLLWQPRIGAWFADKLFEGVPLPPPWDRVRFPDAGRFRSQAELDTALLAQINTTLPAIYRALNCSARVYYYNAAFVRVEDPDVHVSTRVEHETDLVTTIETPVGSQVSVSRRYANSLASHFVRWPIETKADLRVATWRAERTVWRWDQAAFDRVLGFWGDLGAPTMYMPRVNIQDLFINTMGVEQAVFALFDWPHAIEPYFRALDESHDRMIAVINASPIEIVNFGDNLHCGTLPPDWFRRFVLPAYQRRCARLHQAGKFVHAHWDGNTKPLLPLARETGLDGIEAITPLPQGDVTIAEIKDALGDDMFLLDGLPAVYFDRTFPVSRLEEATHELIERFAPRLILGISDEISSTGDIGRIRIVGDIVARYNRAREA